MSSRIDHIALRIPDFDSTIALLEQTCVLRILRMGAIPATGQRIAMLGDGTGMKLELIDAADVSQVTFAHIAFRVDDVDTVYEAMVGDNWVSRRAPRDLAPAQARTALVTNNRQTLDVKLISYESKSADVKEWDTSENSMGGPACE